MRIEASRISQVEHVPKWVPGAGWKDKARVWREAFAAMRDIPYNLVKEQMVSIDP